MIKTFTIVLARPLQESFELITTSGQAIPSWQTKTADSANGFIEWKQSFWSLLGTAHIIARLTQSAEQETTVTVEIHKPFQVLDPFNICNRIFAKLEKSLQRHLARQ